MKDTLIQRCNKNNHYKKFECKECLINIMLLFKNLQEANKQLIYVMAQASAYFSCLECLMI